MNNRLHLLLLATLSLSASAQVSIDKPIVLAGTNADRHVSGLPAAAAAGDALDAGSLQAGAYRYTVATGSNALTAVFSPAIVTPVAGLNLFARITSANTGAVSIAMNGGSPWPVKKNGGADLEAGDLEPGMVGSLVFDGTVFHLTNARRIQRRTCPADMVQVNELYCIEPLSHDTADLEVASVACGTMDARICTWGEWYFACTQAGALGLSDMGNQWEWTNSTANGPGTARVVGATSCTHASTGPAFGSGPRNFRCCYDR
ncbi:MAG: hypothetical protein ABI599_04345 [Flavobacteriales bacterium]